MKQFIQNMRSGSSAVLEVPIPAVRPGYALVRVDASLVSAGTERMLADFAGKSLLGKARSRPDLVRQVLDKARRDGILPTVQAAFNRLEQPMPLGYASAGVITALGEGMAGFHVGQRVACAGSGYAVHAEYNLVPRLLLTPLADDVTLDEGAFVTLGAIALQGLRLAEIRLGERAAVIGLGLLGQIALQLIRAAGGEAFGIDLSPSRVELARQLGFNASLREGAEASAAAFTQGQGFDALLICADTRSSDPLELAGAIARDRAIISAVGAVGTTVPRNLYYRKELHLRFPRSYGPGRYDPAYEEGGHDYPIGQVRWSEGRNLGAVAALLASRKLDVRPLISHRFPIAEAPLAYELIRGKGSEPFLGVLLTYPAEDQAEPSAAVRLLPTPASLPAGTPRVGVLGAGLFAGAVFLPALQRQSRIQREVIASASGLSARHAAQRYGFAAAAAQEEEVLANPAVNTVIILTRHGDHARQALAALRAGKHVWCEKPLALTLAEVEEIGAELSRPGAPLLMVGFNRRFAPLTQRLQRALAGRREPFAAQYRVNAGYLPPEHWLHDPHQGGGRLLGEACHFIDYLTCLAGTPPTSLQVQRLPDGGRYQGDNALLTLRFPDGSLGAIHYLANGDRGLAKERVEVFCGGMSAVLDDFRSLEIHNGGRKQIVRPPGGQDKGHAEALGRFFAAVRDGGPPPIPYGELLAVSRAAVLAAGSDGDHLLR